MHLDSAVILFIDDINIGTTSDKPTWKTNPYPRVVFVKKSCKNLSLVAKKPINCL